MEPAESDAPLLLETSVLIVSHNCAPDLRGCLTALGSSDNPPSIEILVVDCGSTDGSGQIDADFPNVTVLRLPRHFGRTKARNIGARTAKGEFLFLLDPSVEVRPDTVSSLAARLRTDALAVAVSPLLVDEAGRPISRGGPLPSPFELQRVWAERLPWDAALSVATAEGEAIAIDCPDPAAILVRTQAIRGMNYFDERYGEFGSDLELCTQAHKASKRMLLVPGVTAVCHRSATSETLSPIFLSDFGNGLAAYVGKHYGGWPGFRVKAGITLRALARLDLGLVGNLLSGQKIDGSQVYP